ncbi:MAG: hypothetical protein LQ342_006761 [Letrouitia transgressa]|nr:MAG: hypothetical protein LQ342_006761 [Letrouitia transgressa]
MSSITHSLNNLLASFLNVIRAIFDTAFSAIETVFTTASSAIASIADLALGLFNWILRDFVVYMEANGAGFAGNIVIIGLLVAAFVGYSAYQQKQGRNKKGQVKKRM